MAIYAPGKRSRNNRLNNTSRKIVAQLSLTAMVDMFTVLVVFLLMNYRTTETVLYIPKEVELPKASETKELKPAHVVTVSPKEILIDRERIASFREVRDQQDWMVINLRNRLVEMFRQDKLEHESKIAVQARDAILVDPRDAEREEAALYKITIQADRDIDFLTIKKIMYTVTEAGAKEINFAVIMVPKPEETEGGSPPDSPSASI